MNEANLKSDFGAAFGVLLGGGGSLDALLDFCAEEGAFVWDDIPFPLDKPGLADHLAFLHGSGHWDAYQLAPQTFSYAVHGELGTVSGYYNSRGKPKDSGFRQRPGFLSVVCGWDERAGKWRALNIQMSPLLSQVLDASPA